MRLCHCQRVGIPAQRPCSPPQLTLEAKGSTGFGLAIVSAVMEALGGRAETLSKPDQTVFRIILPLAANPPSRRDGALLDGIEPFWRLWPHSTPFRGGRLE
ncbi:hypothetical protein GCM10007382_08630 [Salinibacterium xinjiangense]|nr:hypothetical protein GCM10007382_08630 [Salinibacterium xinjiangense]